MDPKNRILSLPDAKRTLRNAWRGCFLACTALWLGACANAFLGEDVPDTPPHNFDVLWQDMDRYYALFGDKGVDWDSAYTAFRPLVRPDTPGDNLFDTMCQMMRLLDDGHLVIQTAGKTCTAGRFSEDPAAGFNLRTVERFLEAPFRTAGEGRLRYGRISKEGKGIGYLHIQNFIGEGAPIAGWVKAIDEVMADLQDTDALILDIRANGGGNGFNAADLAGRFTDAAYPYLVSQTRNGPERTDLSEPKPWSIKPRGSAAYLKPIALLTNRGTFSAAEWFTLALKSRPQVTVVGTSTGGGLSSRIFRTLPNGWSFSISIQRITDINGALYEGSGIEPDLDVTAAPSAPDHPDNALVTAIALLTNP